MPVFWKTAFSASVLVVRNLVNSQARFLVLAQLRDLDVGAAVAEGAAGRRS